MIGDTTKNDLLKLIFHGTTFTGIARNDAAPLTEYYLSLHTAAPGASGNQTTNEVTYTDYERVAVTRNSSGWTISGSSVTPVDAITFPVVAGAGGEIATYAAIGTAISGTGQIIISGAISPTISLDVGAEPSLNTDSAIILTEC